MLPKHVAVCTLYVACLMVQHVLCSDWCMLLVTLLHTCALFEQEVGCVWKGLGTYSDQWDLWGSVGTAVALCGCGSEDEGTLRAVRNRVM